MSNEVIILTAEKGAGKTTLLQKFCNSKLQVAGILTPIINGERFFYNISTQETFTMHAAEGEEKIAVGKYLFSVLAFKKAAMVLAAATKNNLSQYLIIDEIGPLEMQQYKGLYDVFTKIMASTLPCTTIIVVRPSLAGVVYDFITNTGKNVSILTIEQFKKWANRKESFVDL